MKKTDQDWFKPNLIRIVDKYLAEKKKPEITFLLHWINWLLTRNFEI